MVTMDLEKAEQAILNAIYAAIAWLLFDLGQLFQAQGGQGLSAIQAQPEMTAGMLIAGAGIIGLIYKSRVAAILLLLFFLLPLLLRLVQGQFPSTMVLLFSLVILYFLLAGVFGAFRFHYLRSQQQNESERPE